MNKAQMRTQVADFVGDKNITRYASDQYDRVLDQSQIQFALETKALWKDQLYTTSAGDADYDLPSDFMFEDYALYNGKKLRPISRYDAAVLLGKDWATQEGEPLYFIIDPEEGTKEILLVPIPQDAVPVLLRFFPLPAALSSDASVPMNSSLLMAQFHLGICAKAASLLLLSEDQTPATVQKIGQMDRIYAEASTAAINTFKNTVSAGLNIRGGAKWR